VWRLSPANTDVVDVVQRYSPEGVKARTVTEAEATTSESAAEKLGVWAVRRFPAGRKLIISLAKARASVRHPYCNQERTPDYTPPN
jgi:hypothetical protein